MAVVIENEVVGIARLLGEVVAFQVELRFLVGVHEDFDLYFLPIAHDVLPG
jgi:hypothetical protein